MPPLMSYSSIKPPGNVRFQARGPWNWLLSAVLQCRVMNLCPSTSTKRQPWQFAVGHKVQWTQYYSGARGFRRQLCPGKHRASHASVLHRSSTQATGKSTDLLGPSLANKTRATRASPLGTAPIPTSGIRAPPTCEQFPLFTVVATPS